MGSLAAGCANQEIKPATVLCPLLGATLGAGIAAGGFGGDDAGPMAAGAVLGAAAGYFLCREKPVETPAPTPAAAPAPAPKPVAVAPKDSDGDGVIDPNDKCPGTPPGVKVNAEGCPEVGTTLMSLQGVNFDTDSAKAIPMRKKIFAEAAQKQTLVAGAHLPFPGIGQLHAEKAGYEWVPVQYAPFGIGR